MSTLKDFILTAQYSIGGEWMSVPAECIDENGFCFSTDNAEYSLKLQNTDFGIDYTLSMQADYDTQLKFALSVANGGEAYHLIPCVIYGDNHIEKVKRGEYPSLTDKYSDPPMCSDYWEVRADRAAMPVTFMCADGVSVGVSIDPYSDIDGGYICNGLIAALPNCVGVSLGHTNLPVTFVDKGRYDPSYGQSAKRAAACGHIYFPKAQGKSGVHEIIRAEYNKRRSRAEYKKSFDEAARAIAEACVKLSWNDEWQAYTDMSCKPPKEPELKAWRPIYEIGWTGIAEIAGPLIEAQHKLGLSGSFFGSADNGYQQIDRIIETYNEKSGLFNDLTNPTDSGSYVDGWWAYYGVANGCHCAYTVGKAAYEVVKSMDYLRSVSADYPKKWETVFKVLDTIISVQLDNGNYGYTYSTKEPKMLDPDGFAGCWFMPAMVYAYRLTGDNKYLASAEKAENFYRQLVYDLDCYATPMDTWKAMDEEGNISFVRGTRLLHETTGNERYLTDLEAGVQYEYLWRYGYKSRPEHPPVDTDWNSCGGSVTSVSNPHIHPMGALINGDIMYLYEKTGDEYHRSRSEDGTAWLMQCLECYPQKAGYGQYGVISERWCPSDGLLVETYSDGRIFSSWFSFNLWSAANVLSALLELL